MWLLDSSLGNLMSGSGGGHIRPRLAAALAACAQLSSLPATQRMWSLQSLRKLLMGSTIRGAVAGGSDVATDIASVRQMMGGPPMIPG